MSGNKKNNNDQGWNKPVTTDRTKALLLVLVVFASGMYFQQVMIGLFFMPSLNQPAPGSNNNTSTTTNQTASSQTASNPANFKIVDFKSGYDSINGSYYIRFQVTVQSLAASTGTCHLYLSVLEKGGKVHASDQYLQLNAGETVTEVFTWEVATSTWEQDLIDWSTASVIVVS